MKNIFPSLIGNDMIRRTLSGSLSHAYIIEGPRGSGRLTSARNAVAAVLCENRSSADHALPCGKCSACSRVFRGIHPDSIEFDSDGKKSISVDAVRELRSRVFISPVESEHKFFIIRDADLMTVQAQNALLISLEEPPAFATFILLVTDKSLLLETIRSRCVILSTEKLNDDTIAESLKNTDGGADLFASDPAAFNSIIKAADGSFGEALRLIKSNNTEIDTVYSAAENLIRVILSGSAQEKVAFASAFPKTRDEQDKIFVSAINAVRDIISKKLRTDSSPLFYRDISDASAFSAVPLERLMRLVSAFDDARIAISGNASPTLTSEKVIMIKL